jgi:hypothetical protein
MSDTTPSWGTPPGPGGDVPTQPTPPVAGPPTDVAPAGPSFAPPPAPPGGGSKRGIPTPAFVVVLVLLVAALAFGIVSFLGKNSEADDKQEAQGQLDTARDELASAQDEISSLQDELQGSEETGQALGDLVEQAASAADDLKACADSSGQFITDFSDAVPGIVTTGEIPPAVGDLATQTDELCATANQSYQELIDIFNEINS